MDQIFVIRQLLEKFLEKNLTPYNNYVDYQQAFDSVWQSELRNYGIPEKLVTLLEDIQQDTECNKGGWRIDRMVPSYRGSKTMM